MPLTIPIEDPFSPQTNGGRPTTAGDSPKHVMNASMTPESIKATAPVRNKPALTPNTPEQKAKSVSSGKKRVQKVKDLTVVSTPHEHKKHPMNPEGSYLRDDGVLLNDKRPFGQEEWYPDLTNAYKLKSSSYV